MMNLMKEEWSTFELYYPNLKNKIKALSFKQLESINTDAINLLRDHGVPGFLVPKQYGGKGATAIDAVSFHRSMGALSPSLAIASTMHNFTTAFLSGYSFYGDDTEKYLREIASKNLYLASGFAEGKTGANILEPTMRAKSVEGGYLINGSKKPCTLSKSMDYLTASVGIIDSHGNNITRAIAIIPSSLPGIECKPFWSINSLAGAQNNQVILTDVFVQKEALFMPNTEVPLDIVEAGGFVWFELLVTASYLGVASGFVEKVYLNNRGSAVERTRLLSALEASAAALRGIAYEMDRHKSPEEYGEDIVAKSLLVRYNVQQQLKDIAYHAAELGGGMQFMKDPSIEYSLACCSALSFHPPSRLSISDSLDAYISGGSLEMV